MGLRRGNDSPERLQQPQKGRPKTVMSCHCPQQRSRATLRSSTYLCRHHVHFIHDQSAPLTSVHLLHDGRSLHASSPVQQTPHGQARCGGHQAAEATHPVYPIIEYVLMRMHASASDGSRSFLLLVRVQMLFFDTVVNFSSCGRHAGTAQGSDESVVPHGTRPPPQHPCYPVTRNEPVLPIAPLTGCWVLG